MVSKNPDVPSVLICVGPKNTSSPKLPLTKSVPAAFAAIRQPAGNPETLDQVRTGIPEESNVIR